MSDELTLLVELCSVYDRMGNGLKFRLTQILDGDRLENHPDIALREIADWLQLIVPFLDDPKETIDLVDNIEMYLFGTYLEDNGYD
jgi:hypothetical protein